MKRIAVLIPCLNEEKTIKLVIDDIKQYLPDAAVYVFDNNSSDQTANVAKTCGASVYHVTEQGKGNVVRAMFKEIEADCYIMIDGDYTYDTSNIEKMVDKILNERISMVLGVRNFKNSRYISKVSNIFLRKIFKILYKYDIKDALTGFRAFSREFVKAFPATASGFETEVEMTSYALINEIKIDFVDTFYSKRKSGSNSKIKLLKDGNKILVKILCLYPLTHKVTFSGKNNSLSWR